MVEIFNGDELLPYSPFIAPAMPDRTTAAAGTGARLVARLCKVSLNNILLKIMKSIESFVERLMFSSRWLLAPFYIGLIGAIIILLVKFFKELTALLPQVFTLDGGQIMVGVLTLVDVALVANLLLIIVFAGYENFVSKINTENSEDRPEWMGHVTFSDLKIKLMGSIVAISGIELLKAFVNVDSYTNQQLGWKVGLHMTFVLSGVLFSVMDRLAAGKSAGH